MIVDRKRFLIVHGVSTEAWAKRWGLRIPVSYPCHDCGKERVATIPFAVETFRGLVAPTCECGNEFGPYCVIQDPKHGDLWDWMKRKK